MLRTLHGRTAYFCDPAGPKVVDDFTAVDLIASLWGQDVDLVVLPTERLAEDFFRLRTGVAGKIVQKFVDYRTWLVILGDISAHVTASAALRDFVYESNRRADLWFVADEAELAARLSA